MKKSIDKIINKLPDKQKDIIIYRFGLSGKPKRTLASLGKKYGITRERVRQIEASALKQLKKYAEDIADIKTAYNKYIKYIEGLGGIRKFESFVKDLDGLTKSKIMPEYVDILFAIFGSPKLFGENKDFYSFWYLSKKDLSVNKAFLKKLADVLDKKKQMVIEKDRFDEIFGSVAKTHKITEAVALNFAETSKNFAMSVFGDFGLSKWPEINPKTIRDKSYLVLKKHGKELHFRDIAKEINKTKFDKKKAHPQTVHNELIKDKRFVLVGRGLYSLREFGIEPGTTVEILHGLLKKNGPMTAESIIKFVSNQRILKRNTILINLQNKKRFKKLDGNKYHIA